MLLCIIKQWYVLINIYNQITIYQTYTQIKIKQEEINGRNYAYL
jgi:hypothetical protein